MRLHCNSCRVARDPYTVMRQHRYCLKNFSESWNEARCYCQMLSVLFELNFSSQSINSACRALDFQHWKWPFVLLPNEMFLLWTRALGKQQTMRSFVSNTNFVLEPKVIGSLYTTEKVNRTKNVCSKPPWSTAFFSFQRFLMEPARGHCNWSSPN